MAKKTIYKIESETNDDFIIIGLTTALPDYRLAWFINKELRIQLVKKIDFTSVYEKTAKSAVSCSFFMDQNSSAAFDFFLLNNTPGEHVLFKELKAFNYLLFIQFIELDFDPQTFIEKLSSIAQIMFPVTIEPAQIKAWPQFIEDLELHTIDIKKNQK